MWRKERSLYITGFFRSTRFGFIQACFLIWWSTETIKIDRCIDFSMSSQIQLWPVSIAIPLVLITLLGYLIRLQIDSMDEERYLTTLFVSLGVGLGLFAMISYLLVATIGYSALNINAVLLVLNSILLVTSSLDGKIPIHFRAFKDINIKQHLKKSPSDVGSKILVVLIVLYAFIWSMRSVLYRPTLSEIDPWIWLYDTRYLSLNGIPDFSTAQSYPLGMPFLAISLTSLDRSYEFLYFIFRFMGPFLSIVVTIAAFNLARRIFPNNRAAMCFTVLIFAVSHDIQFQYHLARPQTIAVLLFLVSLDYLFVRPDPSYTVFALLVATTMLFHPLTCAVLIGVCLMVGIFSLLEIEWSSIKKFLPGIIVSVLILLPFLLVHWLNATLASNYAYYFTEYSGLSSAPPWIYAQDRLNDLGMRSVGVLAFGLALYESIRFFYKGKGSKWAACAWLFFIAWVTFSWLPVIFISNNARRAATWALIPTAVLVGSAIARLEDEWIGQSEKLKSQEWHQSIASFGIEPKHIGLLVISLLFFSQTIYGISYTYLGQRYVPDTERQILEYIQDEHPNLDTVFVYDNHIRYSVAQAILYPITPVSNDSIRNQQMAGIESWFSENVRPAALLTKSNEVIHDYAIQMGWVEVLNPSIGFEYGMNLTRENYSYHLFLRGDSVTTLRLIYEEDFTDISDWHTNTDIDFETEDGIARGLLPASPTNWYHFYTDTLSINNTDGIALVIKYRSNTTGGEGRVFGYCKDAREGNYSFYTSTIVLRPSWRIDVWEYDELNGDIAPIESISIGFSCRERSQILYLDFVKIYRI